MSNCLLKSDSIACGVSFATNAFKEPTRPLSTSGDAGRTGLGDPYPCAFCPTAWGDGTPRGDGTPAAVPNITCCCCDGGSALAGDGWICVGALVWLLLLVLCTATVPSCVLLFIVVLLLLLFIKKRLYYV